MKKSWLQFALILMAGMMAACTTSLQIDEGWARPAPAGSTSAVYLIVDNPTAQIEVLLSASTDIAEHVEFHRSMQQGDGTMSMEHQESVPIPARSQVEFKPGGLHIMLGDLSQDLQVGDTFKITLKFQNAGEIELPLKVHEP